MSASNPVALSLAFLIPLGFALIATSGWPVERARRGAVAFFAALGLAVIGYVAVGFALQFGGVGIDPGSAGLRRADLGMVGARPDVGARLGHDRPGGLGPDRPGRHLRRVCPGARQPALGHHRRAHPVDRPARPHPRLGGNRAGLADRRPDLPAGRQLDLGRRLAGQPGPQPRSGPRVCRRRGSRARAPARRGGRGWPASWSFSRGGPEPPRLRRRRCRRPAGRCWRCWAPWRC